MTVYACSTNPGKLAEFELAAKEWGYPEIRICSLPGLRHIPPPEEDGATFEENASAKALYYSEFTQELIFAEDSGLMVDALRGAPGIYSARYAGPHATDQINNEMLLRELRNEQDRQARFVSVIALAEAGEIQTFRGEVDGEILLSPVGREGFGYDPLFCYVPLQLSFAQLSIREKLSRSHRGKALRQLFDYLRRFRRGGDSDPSPIANLRKSIY